MPNPTKRIPHWDVQHYYLCLAATAKPPGEVITLTRGCLPHSRLINARQQSLGHRPYSARGALLRLVTGQHQVLQNWSLSKIRWLQVSRTSPIVWQGIATSLKCCWSPNSGSCIWKPLCLRLYNFWKTSTVFTQLFFFFLISAHS